jgi:hypothetical protein
VGDCRPLSGANGRKLAVAVGHRFRPQAK